MVKKILHNKMVAESAYMVLSQLIYALVLNLFLLNNNIAAGGLAGIATIVNAITPVPVGLLIFAMNIPLFVLSFFIKGWFFTVKNIIASVLYSVFISLTSWLPTLTTNLLIASVCAGVLYGVGVVLSVRGDFTPGNTDLLARLLLTKFKASSIGRMMMWVDGGIVLASMVVLGGFDIGIYAIITLAICAITTDRLLGGMEHGSMCFIITLKDPQAIAGELMHSFNRGATRITAVGMYKGYVQNIILTVVRPKETYKVKEMVARVDPSAFVIVAHAKEVLGYGFSGLP